MIGSYLAEVLVAGGDDQVVVVDDLSRGQEQNLRHIADRIEFRHGDLEDERFASLALGDANTVYHLASRAFGVSYSDGRHLQILHHNEAITQNLLTALGASPPRCLIVASSSCVYPDQGPDTITELPTFTGEPERVNRGYGWAKRFLEQKATLFGQEADVRIVIARPFNIYAERYRWAGEHSQAIPMLVKRVMDGTDPVTIWGSGNQRRSYVHAYDCARMMHGLAKTTETTVANIGTEETFSIMELTKSICAAAGVEPTLRTDASRPEGRFTKSADMTHFRSIVPEFAYAIPLEDGLNRMIDWYHSTDFKAAP